jgi:hypothetical protein
MLLSSACCKLSLLPAARSVSLAPCCMLHFPCSPLHATPACLSLFPCCRIAAALPSVPCAAGLPAGQLRTHCAVTAAARFMCTQCTGTMHLHTLFKQRTIWPHSVGCCLPLVVCPQPHGAALLSACQAQHRTSIRHPPALLHAGRILHSGHGATAGTCSPCAAAPPQTLPPALQMSRPHHPTPPPQLPNRPHQHPTRRRPLTTRRRLPTRHPLQTPRRRRMIRRRRRPTPRPRPRHVRSRHWPVAVFRVAVAGRSSIAQHRPGWHGNTML